MDPIEELIWSKACITKAITKAITITTQKLSPPFNRTITIAIATWALDIDENDEFVQRVGPRPCGQQTNKYATWALDGP